MNHTMNSKHPAQASETPFNMSDYVNFEFDFQNPHQSANISSETSAVEPLQSVSIDDPYAGSVDAVDKDFAGLFQLPDGSNAALGDIVALSPASEDLGMTDSFQTTIDTDASVDHFTIFEPTASIQGVDPAALEMPPSPSKWVPIPMQMKANPQSPAPPQIKRAPLKWGRLAPETQREPSRWVSASPELQQHLNRVYAPQLIRLSVDPNPAPVLYFPAEHEHASPLPSISSLPRSAFTQYEFPHTSQKFTESPSIDPSLLMYESTAPLSSNGMYSPISPITDDEAPTSEDSASTPIQKRTLDADESDLEPAPKRTKTSQVEPLPTVAKDDDSDDDDDEPVARRMRTARRNPLPIVAKDDDSRHESDDDSNSESYNSDSSGLSSASPSPILPPASVTQKGPSALPSSNLAAKKGLNGRYEQRQESRLRDQRRRESNRRRGNSLSAKGKAPNRKMQKLLEEIQDTEEFAEAQDYEAESDESQDFLPRRPVRKGARKSYIGLE